jgi:hypothetical protein
MYVCEQCAYELWFTFSVIASLTAVAAFALGYGLRAHASQRRRQRAVR